MSLVGNVVRAVTQAACNVSMACVDGVTDITEAVTGTNRLTTAVRHTSSTLIRGVHDVTISAIHVGEEAFGMAKSPYPASSYHDNEHDNEQGAE